MNPGVSVDELMRLKKRWGEIVGGNAERFERMCIVRHVTS